MTKDEAIRWYRRITSGEGVAWDDYLDIVERGSIAEDKWYDGVFVLGVEYGVLIALVETFGLTRDDIYPPKV